MCLAHKARVCVRQLLVVRPRMLRIFAPNRQHMRMSNHTISSLLSQALAYCHDIGFAHRDLKPSNILITEARKRYRGDASPTNLTLVAHPG